MSDSTNHTVYRVWHDDYYYMGQWDSLEGAQEALYLDKMECLEDCDECTCDQAFIQTVLIHETGEETEI